MAQLHVDVIGHILTYSTLRTVNAIARSCHAYAALVRAQACDIADQWVKEHAIGAHNDTFIRRLPNGTLHGDMVAHPSGQLIIRWDRGQAISWTHQCMEDDLADDPNDNTLPAMMRGHRDTPHILSDRHHDVKHDTLSLSATGLGALAIPFALRLSQAVCVLAPVRSSRSGRHGYFEGILSTARLCRA